MGAEATTWALVVRGGGSHGIERVPEPSPLDPHDALVEVSHVALCGTDLRLLAGALHDARYPVIPGHEWTGTVRAAASRPELVGTRVVGSNFVPCRQCARCLEGRPQLCGTLDEVGFSLPGACAGLLRLPAANLRPIPETIGSAAGCLVEPLCVAVHAVDRGPSLLGRSVAVLGGGAVGILVAQVALAAGAESVTVVEPVAERRQLARLVGMTHTVDSLDDGGPDGSDAVFDATGSAAAFSRALDIVRPGGSVILVGYSGLDSTALAPSTVMLKELDVVGVLSGVGTLDRALALVSSGTVHLDPLLGAVRPLTDYRSVLGPGAGLRRVLAVAGTLPD
jgi:2-deoxy-scyllo-inosamine dehydrogenase